MKLSNSVLQLAPKLQFSYSIRAVAVCPFTIAGAAPVSVFVLNVLSSW